MEPVSLVLTTLLLRGGDGVTKVTEGTKPLEEYGSEYEDGLRKK